MESDLAGKFSEPQRKTQRIDPLFRMNQKDQAAHQTNFLELHDSQRFHTNSMASSQSPAYRQMYAIDWLE